MNTTTTTTVYTAASIRRNAIALLYNAIAAAARMGRSVDESALAAIDAAAVNYAAAAAVPVVSAVYLYGRMVALTAKGNQKEGFTFLYKCKGMGTLRKLFAVNVTEDAAAVQPVAVPELIEKGTRKPAESKPATIADKVARARYNLAKLEAMAVYETEHRPDGTRMDNGAKEEFAFPSLSEWKQQQAA